MRRCAGSPDCGAGMKILPYSVAAAALTPPTYTGACELHSYPPPHSSPRLSSRPPPFTVAFDPAVPTCQCAFSRSSRVRRLKKLAAIDELSRARHVADLPKTRQTSPTSPSTPRPTTSSFSQLVEGIVRG